MVPPLFFKNIKTRIQVSISDSEKKICSGISSFICPLRGNSSTYYRPHVMDPGGSGSAGKNTLYCLKRSNMKFHYLDLLYPNQGYYPPPMQSMALLLQASTGIQNKHNHHPLKFPWLITIFSGRSLEMLLHMWSIMSMLLVFAFSCNLRAIFLKPNYESPLDNSEQVVKSNKVF